MVWVRSGMVNWLLSSAAGHLLLNGSEDAGVAGVQAYDVFALVVESFHQFALFLECHIGRGAYDGARLVALGERLGHQRTSVEDQVGSFEHLAASDADQVGVAGACAYNLDVAVFFRARLAFLPLIAQKRTGVSVLVVKNLRKNLLHTMDVAKFNAQHGNISYNISADGSTTSDQLLAFRGLGLNGAAFTSADDISVGDKVVIYGNLTKYNTTYEFAQDNYLASITPKQLAEIRLSGNYPTTFVEGAEFSHEGIEVTAYFDDGSVEDATTKAEFSEPDMTQIGEQQVTVSYTRKGLTASDVYTITIVEIPRHNATFSVNGTTTTAQVKEGLAIEFPENPADISGKSFVGWTTTEIAAPTDVKPEFVTSATMGTADVTFYAVFAEKTGDAPALIKLGSDYEFTAGDNLVIVATSGETQYGLYQETVSNSFVKNFEFDGDAEKRGCLATIPTATSIAQAATTSP